jgi:hypothetical protein
MTRLGVLCGLLCSLFLAGAEPARATVITLSDPSQLNPADVMFDYPQPEGTTVASPYSVAAVTTTLAFSTATGNPFFREDQGSLFGGDFPNGTRLLSTNASDPFIPRSDGPVTITFTPGVREVGVGAESELPDPNHVFTFSAYDGAALLGTLTVPGDGFVAFGGFRATGSDVITQLVIGSDDNNFDVGPVTFGNADVASVPEPTTFTLLCISVLSIGGMICARR